MGLPPGTGTSSIVSSERVVAIVQARLGSVRLPGKVLSPVLGKPVLAHLVERLSRADSIDEVVLAIPDTAANNELAVLADELRIGCFRGDEDDVLLRYSEAASAAKAIDEHNSRCSWGFYIASQALRGRGLGSSAWFQTLRYAFDDLELEKVSSEVLDTNLSVIALHERFGFRREAYFRSHVRRGDERIDVIGLAMLRADWQLCRPGIEDQLRRNERSHADLKGK